MKNIKINNDVIANKTIDLTQTAQAIVETLANCNFNDCTDSSGYYVVKYIGELERCVDVYKSNADGEENDHYVVYCSYEDEQSNYVYTEDLSVESLEKVLRELANHEEAGIVAVKEEVEKYE